VGITPATTLSRGRLAGASLSAPRGLSFTEVDRKYPRAFSLVLVPLRAWPAPRRTGPGVNEFGHHHSPSCRDLLNDAARRISHCRAIWRPPSLSVLLPR
jgi:hypothetical protein